MPGGYRLSGGGFGVVGYGGYWWTATEGDSGYAYHRDMDYDEGIVSESYVYYKSGGASVRCVSD